jgi:hypothetical protein
LAASIPSESLVTGDAAGDAASSAVEELLADESNAWEDDGQLDLIRRLAQWGGDPTEVVEVVIQAMSHRELRSALTSLTDLTDEDLDEIRDLHTFARRISEVAMDGIMSSGGPEDITMAGVEFSRSVDELNTSGQREDRFATDERIYAVFPSEEYRGGEIFVKWYRADDPKILLFERMPIQEGSESNYVWLEPDGEWPEGEYKVEFYSADEEMAKVAVGRYQIDSKVPRHLD